MAAEAPVWRQRFVASAILAAIVFGALGSAYAVTVLLRPSAGTVPIGGPFALTTQAGTTLSDVDLKGTPFTVFFGFTHCPEICPTTLWEMSEALKALGPDAGSLKVLFVTVDPERDTAEALANYLQAFDPRIVGLTGNPQQVAAMANAYRAYWRKVPLDDGDYTMDHTASVFLMDAGGRFFGTIGYEEEPSVRMDKLKRLLATGT